LPTSRKGITTNARLRDEVREFRFYDSDNPARGNFDVGVQHAFNLKPDLVTGPATNTSAGIDLVKKLSGVNAINILDETSFPAFRIFLHDCLNLKKKLN
jgi:hypothetical protein